MTEWEKVSKIHAPDGGVERIKFNLTGVDNPWVAVSRAAGYGEGGRILTDYDIELDNFIIQVKSGTAKGLTTQIQNTAASTGKTVIGDEKLNLDAIKSIEHYGSISSHDVTELRDRYCVDYGVDHIFYDYQGDSMGDYEEDDLKKIPFKKPHFIMMVYTSEELIKKVLRQDNFLRGIYVDNDYDLIIPIEEFIKHGMPINKR